MPRHPNRCMKTSTAREAIVKTLSKRSSVTSIVTGPRIRPSLLTPRGCCWRAGPTYVLHHALRTHTLAHTALATAQPSTVILTLVTVQVVTTGITPQLATSARLREAEKERLHPVR